MVLVVDPWHWLDKNGNPPTDNPRLRRNTLRVARIIEYGGPLKRLECRETLLECKRKPGGKPCMGLLWVLKTEEDAILAFCRSCGCDEAVVHNWQGTSWADGMMPPIRTVPVAGRGEPAQSPSGGSPRFMN
jgi:hypothetical protein